MKIVRLFDIVGAKLCLTDNTQTVLIPVNLLQFRLGILGETLTQAAIKAIIKNEYKHKTIIDSGFIKAPF